MALQTRSCRCWQGGAGVDCISFSVPVPILSLSLTYRPERSGDLLRKGKVSRRELPFACNLSLCASRIHPPSLSVFPAPISTSCSNSNSTTTTTHSTRCILWPTHCTARPPSLRRPSCSPQMQSHARSAAAGTRLHCSAAAVDFELGHRDPAPTGPGQGPWTAVSTRVARALHSVAVVRWPHGARGPSFPQAALPLGGGGLSLRVSTPHPGT